MNPVEEYIQNCDDSIQEMLFTLHDVFTNDLGLSPKIKFRIPFYYGNRWILYVNPLKVMGIEICYLNARAYDDPAGILNFKNRKKVGGITVMSLENMPLESIVEITKIAINYDKTLKK